jgi:hypothetical protein
MPEITEGELSLNFGLVQLSGKLSEIDRQCAWELYSEMVTRVAVTGKRRDETSKDFSGEIYVESLGSLHAFFSEARGIMKRFPVGRLKSPGQPHLGTVIHDMLADVLRPFLEKWQADVRSWWSSQDVTGKNWIEVQKDYPRSSELLEEWSRLRRLMRKVEHQLRDTYKLTAVDW